MFYKIEREARDIEQIINWAVEGNQIGTHYTGMTYEQGILAMFDWLTGATEDRPDEE